MASVLLICSNIFQLQNIYSFFKRLKIALYSTKIPRQFIRERIVFSTNTAETTEDSFLKNEKKKTLILISHHTESVIQSESQTLM
jgi:hypothetical protein